MAPGWSREEDLPPKEGEWNDRIMNTLLWDMVRTEKEHTAAFGRNQKTEGDSPPRACHRQVVERSPGRSSTKRRLSPISLPKFQETVR